MRICDCLTFPLYLFDEDAVVIWSNARARTLAEREANQHGPFADLQRRLKHHVRSARSWLSNRMDVAVDGVFDVAAAELIRIAEGDAVFVVALLKPMQTTDSSTVRGQLTRFGLTPTERWIAEQMLCGRTTTEIAQSNAITLQTVRTHIKRIYSKMGVHCREKMISRIHAF